MDTFSHGFWVYIITRVPRKPLNWKPLVFFGMLPDLLWLPATGLRLLSSGRLEFFQPLYNVSHSLVVWLGFTVFLLLKLRRNWFALTWPWVLHVVIDIPGHQGLLTPFLWPISSFKIHGWWEWLSVPWLVGNWVVLAAVLALMWVRKTLRRV